MTQGTDLGTVRIRNEVIGSIAALAAKEVEGVVDVWNGPLSLVPRLSDWLGVSGVQVDTRNQEVRVNLKLVVEYGVSLPDVAIEVQHKVQEMVERMTHLSGVDVQVSIHHVKSKRS